MNLVFNTTPTVKRQSRHIESSWTFSFLFTFWRFKVSTLIIYLIVPPRSSVWPSELHTVANNTRRWRLKGLLSKGFCLPPGFYQDDHLSTFPSLGVLTSVSELLVPGPGWTLDKWFKVKTILTFLLSQFLVSRNFSWLKLDSLTRCFKRKSNYRKIRLATCPPLRPPLHPPLHPPLLRCAHVLLPKDVRF